MCMKEKGRVTQMKTAKKKREKYILALVFNLDCNYDGDFFSQQSIFTSSFPPLFVLCC